MKPFSVSVSQDFLGMAKIGRVYNIHYSIIRIYHTFCIGSLRIAIFQPPHTLSTSPLGTAARSIPAPYQCYGVPRWGDEFSRISSTETQWLGKATNPSFSWGVTYGGFLKWWLSPTNPWVFLLKMIILGVLRYHHLRKHPYNWVVVSNMFYFHPCLGKWPKLTNIFQNGLKPPPRWWLITIS